MKPSPHTMTTPTQALADAAQAVLDRWNSPKWEWLKHGPTADLMSELQQALAAHRAAQPKRIVLFDTETDCQKSHRECEAPGVCVRAPSCAASP